jgi:hypothetical protein
MEPCVINGGSDNNILNVAWKLKTNQFMGTGNPQNDDLTYCRTETYLFWVYCYNFPLGIQRAVSLFPTVKVTLLSPVFFLVLQVLTPSAINNTYKQSINLNIPTQALTAMSGRIPSFVVMTRN